jgi:TATA-box binding protein (TBP) (component of TFIID and TFIIIB)
MDKPTLSTMVVLYTTNLKFDTNKLVELLPINETIIKVEKRGFMKKGESKRDKIKRRSKKETTSVNNTGFGHNSITIVVLNDGNGELPRKEITVKIFQNGVFHLTGVLDHRYDSDSIHRLIAFISEHARDSVKEFPEKIEVLNRRVVLMNYITKLSSNETVARESLYNSIRAMNNKNIQVHYDPDVYPGVKIHIGEGNWTAKIFRTGKIILTGITDNDQCIEFMKQLLYLFELVLPKKTQLTNTLAQAVLS